MKELDKIIAELDKHRKDEIMILSKNTGADAQSVIKLIKKEKEEFKSFIGSAMNTIGEFPALEDTVLNNFKKDLEKVKSVIDNLINLKIR